MLNGEIENAMFQFQLTLDPARMKANAEIIEQNINTSYTEIQRRCKLVVDKIDKILND